MAMCPVQAKTIESSHTHGAPPTATTADEPRWLGLAESHAPVRANALDFSERAAGDCRGDNENAL
jgi:hypothetical protein